MPDTHIFGGIEVYLKEALPLLVERGQYEIIAVVTQDSLLYQHLQKAGVPVQGIPFRFTQKSLIRSLWINPWGRMIDLGVYVRLHKILKAEKPDLVHIHSGRFEQTLIKKAGYPMVYTYHGYGGPYNLENATNPIAKQIYIWCRPFFRWMIPALDGMTIVSDYERLRIQREGFLPTGYNPTVIHQGVPIDKLLACAALGNPETLRQSLGVPENARLVSFICRLTRDKNPTAFLRIARRVLQDKRLKHPVYFLVAGEGKMSDEFTKTFRQDPLLSIHGRYLGFRSDVPELLNASDITVSTSIQEGFGLRVLESLVFGKPCVTYATGGVPEVLSLLEGQDWLVKNNDEDDFVEKLLAVLNLPDTELKRLAPILQAHSKQFDLSIHLDRMEAFYGEVFRRLTSEGIEQEG
jgi:glycosyltransferase involved in cell wall biosynthesis